jgi:hypothetical protein
MRTLLLLIASLSAVGCAAVNDFTVPRPPQSQTSNVVPTPSTEGDGEPLRPKGAAAPLNTGQSFAGAVGITSLFDNPGTVGAVSAVAIGLLVYSAACSSPHACSKSTSSYGYVR